MYRIKSTQAAFLLGVFIAFAPVIGLQCYWRTTDYLILMQHAERHHTVLDSLWQIQHWVSPRHPKAVDDLRDGHLYHPQVGHVSRVGLCPICNAQAGRPIPAKCRDSCCTGADLMPPEGWGVWAAIACGGLFFCALLWFWVWLDRRPSD